MAHARETSPEQRRAPAEYTVLRSLNTPSENKSTGKGTPFYHIKANQPDRESALTKLAELGVAIAKHLTRSESDADLWRRAILTGQTTTINPLKITLHGVSDKTNNSEGPYLSVNLGDAFNRPEVKPLHDRFTQAVDAAINPQKKPQEP